LFQDADGPRGWFPDDPGGFDAGRVAFALERPAGDPVAVGSAVAVADGAQAAAA